MPIKNKRPYVSKNNLVYGKYWGETFIISLRSIPSLLAMPLFLGQAEGGPDLGSRAAPCCGQCGATSAWLVRRTPARSDLAGGRMLTQCIFPGLSYQTAWIQGNLSSCASE